MALIVDTESAFFRIRENEKNEFVAVGTDGNILRWGETKGDEQEWLFLPMGERKYRIMTKSNGQYMGVGSNGNVLRWDKADDGSQIFGLVNEDAQGSTMNIQTSDGEFVAVGSNGNVLRWGKTNGKEHLFTLEPRDPASKPKLPEIEASPDQIGDIPRLKSLEITDLPLRSKAKVVGAALVPATLVEDNSYSDKIAQMKANPYYIARRSQYWSREDQHGYAYEHAAGEGITFKTKVVYEVSTRSSRTSEETWGWKFSINTEMSVSAEKNGVGVTASSGMAFEIAHQMKVSITEEKNTLQRNEHTVKRHYDADQPQFVVVGWSLVNVYTLLKADGKTVVSEVEAGSNNSLRKDSFPPKTPNPE